MNIGSLLTKAASSAPEHVCTIYRDVRRTYQETNDRANRLASAIQRAGISRGDRVVILQHNCPELLESIFGIFKAGAVAVPVNSRLHPKEYAYIIADSGAKAVIFTGEFAAGLASVRSEIPSAGLYICIGDSPPFAQNFEVFLTSGDVSFEDELQQAGDIAWLFYTSGTTGKPKGAMVTHGNLQFMTDRYPREVYSLGAKDVVMHAGPMTHGSGLWALPITAAAATQLIPSGRSFDPDHILKLVQDERVTKIAFIAPTMITMLLNSPAIGKYDTSSLRFIGYGGSPMYLEDLKRAIHAFGPVFCQIYGQGESPMTISMLTPDDHRLAMSGAAQERLASAGRVRKDITVAVLDSEDRELRDNEIGEIAIKGDVVMSGYWKKPEATEEAFKNGWYHTGDLGKRDSDGFLYLLDRKKELIISGGANIYPREVEEVLLLHPGVLEVAVIGVPDQLWGESVMAVVRLRPGAAPADSELGALCREHLAGYKKPRFFRYVTDLPKNGYGKILKRELKQQILAEMSGEKP